MVPDGSQNRQRPAKLEGRDARITRPFPHRDARNAVSQSTARRRKLFIGNVISVALTTYLTMPLFIKTLGWWLFPKSDTSKIAVNAAGTALIFLLYAIEVAALWHLL
jgi:hypothetical protein